MNESPNLLIIYIPILTKELLNLPDEFEFSSLVSYDFNNCFKRIEKYSLMKIIPINRGDIRLKKYFRKTILPNKVNVTLDLFHIESKIRENRDDFYFFRVEIYSSNTEVNYIKFINYYYDNKAEILNFLLLLLKLGNSNSDFMISLIQKEFQNNQFIYFNIIFFKPLVKNKMNIIKDIYLTEKDIINNNRFEIYADLQGRLSVFLNKRVTNRSGFNLKLIGFRVFLLRFFTWLYQKGYEGFSTLLYDIFNYSDYLLFQTRQLEIYRVFIRLRNYNLAYGDYQFQDGNFNLLEESEKTWKKLIQILDVELDLKSIPKKSFIHEGDFNKYIYKILKLKLPNIKLNKYGAGGHMDLSVGNQVAIEVKKIESKTPFDELTGQIEEDLRIFTIKYGIAYGIDYTKRKLYTRHNTHKFGPLSNIIYIIKPYPF